jgi:hypothetical protein
MAHEVVPQFLDRWMSFPPTVKMPHLGFWISEPFYPNGKRDLFPSIRNGGDNER